MSHSTTFLLPFIIILTLLLTSAHSRQCPILLPNYNATDTPSFLSNSIRPISRSTDITARVLRGTTLNSTLLPYVAALFVRSGGTEEFFCTAIVVGLRTLITAGHCVAIFFLDEVVSLGQTFEYYAYFGAERTSRDGATGRQIKSIFIHPNFDMLEPDTFQYDIAYFTLYDEIPSSNAIMKVNANSSNPVTGSVVRSIGYGAQTVFHNPKEQMNYEVENDLVKQLDLPVVSNSYCRNTWTELSEQQATQEYQYNIKANYQFCAGYLNGGCGLWYVLYYIFLHHHLCHRQMYLD